MSHAAEHEQQLLASRAERYARLAEAPHDQIEVVAFRRDGSRYAVSLTDLQAIRRLGRGVTRIPGASPVVPAVVYERGTILSLHDLRALKVVSTTDEMPIWVLVGEVNGDLFGLLADEVEGVMAVPVHEILPVPVTTGELAGCFRGLADTDLLLLDLPAMRQMPRFFRAF